MNQNNKEKYADILRGKAELEKWGITTESDSDKKLYELFFGDIPKKTKKMTKNVSMTNLVFIVFGRNNTDLLLKEGLKKFD